MKKNAILLNETLKETNRPKSNCSANGGISALLMVHHLLLLLATAMPNLCIIPPNRELRNKLFHEYAIYEIANPQSYCGEFFQAVLHRLSVDRRKSTQGHFLSITESS